MGILWGEEPVWVDGLLSRLRDYLVAQALYPLSAVRVYLGNPDDYLAKKPPREQFIVLGPSRFLAHQQTVEGGGSYGVDGLNPATRVDGLFTLTQYARLQLDRDLDDARLMEDRSFGLSEAVRKLIATLQLWDAAESDLTPLVEPARLVGVEFRPRLPATGWAAVASTWQLHFAADLTPPETP